MSENATDLFAAAPDAASPSSIFDSAPDAGERSGSQPLDFTAFQATASGIAPADAHDALALSRRTGLRPTFVADNLQELQQRAAREDFAGFLRRAPTVAQYAAQSAVHAAAVKPDVGVWEALEQGFNDLGYGALATEQMTFPTDEGEGNLQAFEQGASDIDQRHSGMLADLARSVPSIATYFLAGAAGKSLGKQPGEIAATAATMYALNRGVLYRRIMQQMPIPASDEEGDYDPIAYEARARKFATEGGIVSATIGAGLASAVSMAAPGAARKIQSVSTGILSRVFADPVAMAVVDNLTQMGGKTLAGALMMAGQAVVDDDNVRNAVTGKSDDLASLEAGWDTFKKSLLAAGLLSTIAHGPALLHDIGAARTAKAHVARLDAMVEASKNASLIQRAPAEAEPLLAKMAAQGSADTVYVDHAAASQPEVAAKLVEALADEGQALAEAQATQGEVPVPTEKYLTRLADVHDQIREDVKLDPEGMTLRQAEAVPLRLEDRTDLLQRFETQEALKEWLGKSTVVDKNGEPQIAYHGTARNFDDFSVKKAGSGSGWRTQKALFFAMDPEVASHYAEVQGAGFGETKGTEHEGRVFLAYLKAENPFVSDMEFYNSKEMAAQIRKAKKEGHDSIAFPKMDYGFEKGTIAVFDPDQVKSAMLNRNLPEKAQQAGAGGAGGGSGAPPGGGSAPSDGERGPGPDHSSVAAEMIDGKRIADIQPRRYELAAQRAADRLTEMAKGSAQSASKPGQEINATVKMAKSADLEDARDRAREFAKRAGEVRKEMDRAATYLVSRNTPEAIAGLAKVGPEYADAFRSIVATLNGEQGANPGAIDGLLRRMDAEGHPVAFDEVALRELLDKPRDWNQLTPPEARNVVDAVKNLRRSARLVQEISVSDKRQSLRDVVGSIAAEASTRKDLGAPPVTDSAAAALEEVGHRVGLFNAANLKPETIFTQLGDTAHRLFEDKIIGARNYKNELQGTYLRHFVENFDKQMRGLSGWLRKRVTTSLAIPKGVDLDGTRVNNETLAMAFLNLGTASNEQRLLSGYQWDPAQVRQEIGKNLTRDKLDLLQGILSYNDEKLWPLVSAHAEKVTGVAPPKIVAQDLRIPLADGTVWEGKGGYFPAAPNRRALNVPDRAIDGVQQFDPAVRATVQASFVKTRSEKASYPVDLNWSRYPAHIASVFHYLAYDEPVRDMGKLLRDQEFQYTARHFVGEEKLQQLKEDNKVWARGSAGDSNGILSYIDQLAARVLRTRAISNALAFSTPIALGQESHIQYAVTSGQISLKNATAAMTRQLPFTDTWAATRAISDEVRLRSDRYSDQFREAISGQPARTLLGHGVDRAAFAQMEVADAILSHVIFDAAVNDALEAKKSTQDAVLEGNRKVRLLMPSHNPLEMAPIVRSRGTIGALMLFRGLPNVVWNVEAGLYDQARQQVAGASGARQIAGAGGRVALNTARAVASVAVLHMLGRLFMSHGKKDEDGEGIAGWGTWAEREALASQFSRIPLGRDVAEPIIDAFQHDKPIAKAMEDIRVAPDLAVIQNIVKDLGKIGSDSTADEDRVQAAVNTALTTLGAGGRPVTKGPRYVYDLQQGNVDARGPLDVAGGLIYGQRPRQEKNIFTAAQDRVSGE